MYKIFTRILLRPGNTSKFLLVMKLTTVLLLATMLQVSAATYAQRITLSEKNASLAKVLKKITAQSGYSFLYEDQNLNDAKSVNVAFSNLAFNEALEKLFNNQPLTYTIKDKTVVIKPKEQPLNNQNADKTAGIDIRGKVLDEEGKPLGGATIRVKNVAGKTAVSNFSGDFQLKDLDPNATLVVSFTGYLSKEVAVKNQTQLTVALAPDQTKLNEVMVIGYGTTKKSDLTGSVGRVNMSDLDQAPVRSFDEALAGRVAGMQVTSSEGMPGAGIDIIVRGASSLTQDNSPLYVIDGFPIENYDNNAINPSEIESIDVLKDASATAIYGSRGSNGVIIITTKRGKIGDPTIRYNGSYGLQQNIHNVPLMDPYEYLKLQSEINLTNVQNAYFGPIAGTNPVQYKYGLEDYRNAEGIDWQSQLFRVAPMQNHSLSMSGGNSKTRYSASGQLFRQDGTIINSGFRRYQGKLTLDQIVNPKLKVGGDLTYTNTLTYGSPTSTGANSAMNNFLYSVWGYRPISPIGEEEADDIIDEPTDDFVSPGTDYRFNPIKTAQNQLRNSYSNNFIGNGYVEYTIIPGLKLRISGGVNKTTRRNDSFNNSNTYSGSPLNPLSNGPNGSVIYYETNAWQNENILTYDKTFNKNHKINIVGGFNSYGTKYNYYGASAITLPNESLGLSGLSTGIPQPIASYNSQNTLVSTLARVNYTYKDKYLLTASMRADGSSRFAPGNQWGYFPSAAFAWRIINENFLKNISYLSNAKIRVSWGLTGNNRVGDDSRFAQMTYPIASDYSFNKTIAQGINITNLGSPSLKWETTAMTDVGLDIGFLKERISLTVDYYRKNTTNLLLNASLPYTTGYASAYKNIGATMNEGLEISLSTVNIKNRNFSWNTNFNIAFNRNKVVELTENQESITSTISWDSFYGSVPLYLAKIGQPMGQIYGYIFDGVYQYSDFNKTNGSYVLKPGIATNGNPTPANIQPGDIKYRDINGDGVVNDYDRTVIGRAYPISQGGMANNFSYKAFDLGVFMQWSYGNDIVNANRLMFEMGNKSYLNQYATFENRWSPTNTNTTMPRAGGQYGYLYSSRVVEDGSFLRLKTVSFGYTVPSAFIKRIGAKSLRVYAAAQNLVTWTKYTGPDPEVSVKRTALTPGFDYSAYPRARTITFGVNLAL